MLEVEQSCRGQGPNMYRDDSSRRRRKVTCTQDDRRRELDNNESHLLPHRSIYTGDDICMDSPSCQAYFLTIQFHSGDERLLCGPFLTKLT